MGKAFRASLLVLLLSCTAQAGWIQNGSPDPPPPPASLAQETSSGGDMQNDSADSLTQIALDILSALL